MRPAVLVAAVLCSVPVATGLAAAQAPGPASTETVSYRSTLLVVDGLSLATTALAVSVDGGEYLTPLAVTGYALGAPFTHLAHRRGGAAVRSLALRVGLPWLGGLLGYHLGPEDIVCADAVDGAGPTGRGCREGSAIGTIVGVVAGGATAIYLDARYLGAYERSAAPTWGASLHRTDGGALVGIGRAF